MKKLVIALVIILCAVSLHFGYSAVKGIQSVKAVQTERLAQLNF